jgi:uncharacterized protein (DUF1810 family)
MRKTGASPGRDDPFDLRRFMRAQEDAYDGVLAELRGGQKRSHWMWYMFPQIDGLGHSATAKHFAITGTDEARQYLTHPVLGARLVECADVVLSIEGRLSSAIFGYTDNLKLKSSMTLFESVAEPGSVFARVLDKYFDGERDVRTLRLLEILKEKLGEEKE